MLYLKLNYYLLLILHIVRAFERTTPIFFDSIQNGEAGEDFFHTRNAAFQHAGTNCLPSVIRMGEFTQAGLEEHIWFFQQRLTGSPSRLPLVYSIYRLFAFKVSGIQ